MGRPREIATLIVERVLDLSLIETMTQPYPPAQLLQQYGATDLVVAHPGRLFDLCACSILVGDYTGALRFLDACEARQSPTAIEAAPNVNAQLPDLRAALSHGLVASQRNLRRCAHDHALALGV